ncbi:hypothetical protein Rhe02_83890 [Rhizocola hellebori]|uniref:Uncharacterized protein n=2 Tax=Rhizocola hellebori TaxID=1392758 RepID=A0A8J3QHV4_9ACTN|nr:hypothetical protein Rhe02_83890 [Rhizocola hellebori]
MGSFLTGLGFGLDTSDWLDDQPFLTNIGTALIGALIGIPFVLVIIQGMIAWQKEEDIAFRKEENAHNSRKILYNTIRLLSEETRSPDVVDTCFRDVFKLDSMLAIDIEKLRLLFSSEDSEPRKHAYKAEIAWQLMGRDLARLLNNLLKSAATYRNAMGLDMSSLGLSSDLIERIQPFKNQHIFVEGWLTHPWRVKYTQTYTIDEYRARVNCLHTYLQNYRVFLTNLSEVSDALEVEPIEHARRN